MTITITAIIRAKAGLADLVHKALLDSGENVRMNEPDTLGYHIGRDISDPLVFTTYERFRDQAAMERHNETTGKIFFATAGEALDGPVTFAVCEEIFTR
jgi:quinol monooxygenase YgiN